MKNLKRNLASAFEIPQEILLDLPLITITGRESLIIENYKGIVQYDQAQVRINTNSGIVEIKGSDLLLKNITSENITVTGVINNIEFLV